ncbi:Wd-repeat protein [Operophtera brumata]|uniref:Wd-repeat protein n=1 Tax=Operophtera brumata TaxID=104452 RepID=A0A0L7L0Z9_OPEBR|nr:Wd-repeat protein [Operophtera brumata]
MRGTLLQEAQGSDRTPARDLQPRGYISHNYAEQSTSEDPRMMAFFDSLVQRELECLAEETDSLDGRRSKHSRTTKILGKSKSKNVSGTSTKGKRTPARRTRGPRRPAPRTMTITNSYTGHASNYTQGMEHLVDPLGVGQSRSLGVGQSRSLGLGQSHSRISAPSSERTDSDDAQLLFRNSGRVRVNDHHQQLHGARQQLHAGNGLPSGPAGSGADSLAGSGAESLAGCGAESLADIGAVERADRFGRRATSLQKLWQGKS